MSGVVAALLDEDGVADLDAVVEIDHVRNRHSHASVRRGRAERGELIRAMDAGAVEDPDPARLQRIRRDGWNHLPCQAARPGRVGHMPGGVDLLVLGVVEAGRGLEALLADGDRVALLELQVVIEAQGEVRAVDVDVARIRLREILLADVRLGLVDAVISPALTARPGWPDS